MGGCVGGWVCGLVCLRAGYCVGVWLRRWVDGRASDAVDDWVGEWLRGCVIAWVGGRPDGSNRLISLDRIGPRRKQMMQRLENYRVPYERDCAV